MADVDPGVVDPSPFDLDLTSWPPPTIPPLPPPSYPVDDVDEDDEDPPAPPLPTGDRRETLLALRDELAARIPNADDRSVAALSRQLQQVLADIDDSAPPPETSSLGALLKSVPNTAA